MCKGSPSFVLFHPVQSLICFCYFHDIVFKHIHARLFSNNFARRFIVYATYQANNTFFSILVVLFTHVQNWRASTNEMVIYKMDRNEICVFSLSRSLLYFFRCCMYQTNWMWIQLYYITKHKNSLRCVIIVINHI